MKTRHEIESIARSKKKMRMAAIIGSAFVLLLAAAIVLMVVLPGVIANDSAVQPEIKSPTPLEGEGVYYNNLIAYPKVSKEDIYRITVNNNNTDVKDGKYTLVRDSSVDNSFLLTYMEDGKIKIYYPAICEQTGIKYEDLYAVETSDGYGTIPKITYLTSALENLYFGERIKLSKDEAEREAQYAEFGFGGDNETRITFDYYNSYGELKTHSIRIGDKTANGTGYYFMVDGRDYVYNSLSTYFDYALMGFYSFVNTTLIAEGLEYDSTYEPMLTTNFTQWKSEVHKEAGISISDTIKELGADGAKVIVGNDILVPISPADFNADPSAYNENLDGYAKEGYEDSIIDLYTNVDSSKVKKVLMGKSTGKQNIYITVPYEFNSSKYIDFSDTDSIKYSYEIIEIEAIVTDDEDVFDRAVSENDTVRVAYTYTVNGKEISPIISHAVLDISASALPEGARALVGKNIGKLDEPISFDINYTKDNALSTTYETRVTAIHQILDAEGQLAETIDENTTVITYSYCTLVNGRVMGQISTVEIDLSELETEAELEVKRKLIGKGLSEDMSLAIEEGVLYSELFGYFQTYLIDDVKYFTTRQEVVSFAFLNNSVRDPFYGESIYANNTDGKVLYGLDSTVCEQIVKLLGGIESSSTASEGLAADELESIGITPDKLLAYKGSCLWENVVYFELPRGILIIDSGDEDVIDDYRWKETLGFTLYISKLQDDGTRYVASDMYDIIAKISNDYFFFLEESFVDFWARENLFMTDVANIQQIQLDFMMTDFYGEYILDVVHKDVYLTDEGVVHSSTPPESYYSIHDYIDVNISPVNPSSCSPNKLVEYLVANMAQTKKDYVNLGTFFEQTVDDSAAHTASSPDSLGTSCFKDFIRSIFYVEYEGALSEGVGEPTPEEIIESCKMLMRFSVKIDTDADGESSDEDYYTYEFYRFDDRRVLVRLYKEDNAGNMISECAVSDFYISTYGFKKMVKNFEALLNGVDFDMESGYDW